MEKKRVGGHRGRKGDSGKVISARHNDRNFDLENAEHIDGHLTAENKIWKYETDLDTGNEQTLDDYEQTVYEKYFSKALEERNEAQIKNRHKNRVQSMEQFRRNAKACPEEVIWTIGKAGEAIDPQPFIEVFNDFMKWHEETFKNILPLDAALHVDEPQAAPHIHQRQVWLATTLDDESGEKYFRVNQGDALEEMGIKRPNLNAKESRTNNAKVTYTAMCRQKMMDIAEAHGIEIEREPDLKGKNGLTIVQYKLQMRQKELKEINEKIQAAKDEYAEVKKANDDFVRSLEPTPTKKAKNFIGKEKEIPKTEEELQHDREVLAAQAVLKDKDEVDEKKKELAEKEQRFEEKCEQEREEIQNDREEMAKNAMQQEEKFREKEAAMREDFTRQLSEQAKGFTQQITQLKTENNSLNEIIQQLQQRAKSMAIAVAIRARTMLEKSLKAMGLQLPQGHTTDEQIRNAEHSLTLEENEKGR